MKHLLLFIRHIKIYQHKMKIRMKSLHIIFTSILLLGCFLCFFIVPDNIILLILLFPVLSVAIEELLHLFFILLFSQAVFIHLTVTTLFKVFIINFAWNVPRSLYKKQKIITIIIPPILAVTIAGIILVSQIILLNRSILYSLIQFVSYIVFPLFSLIPYEYKFYRTDAKQIIYLMKST